jgi:hypothetical protein
MIIKANRHGNGPKLAAYLMDGGRHGERVETPRLKEFGAAEDIFDAFRDIEVLAGATKAERPFFHVQVRLPDHDHLSRAQWDQTADRIQRRLGLEGQARADVYHRDEKSGELHLHLVFSLIDADTLKAKPLPFFKFRLKALARELEKEFDITRVKSEREGPIKFGATKAEEQQAQRLGFNKDAVRNAIRNCWDTADCGRSFDAALAEAGFILALGDRRNYVVIDMKGGIHALGKRILGVSAQEVNQRLSDLDRGSLPTVEQARTLMLDLPRDRVEALGRELADVHRKIEAELRYTRRDPVREEMQWADALAHAAIEKEKVERKFVPKSASEKTWAGSREKERVGGIDLSAGDERMNVKAFREALDNRGVAFARVTPAEAHNSHRERAFAREIGRKAPEYSEGEIVVVREQGAEYLRQGEWTTARRVYQLDQTQAEKYLAHAAIDKDQLPGIETTKRKLDDRQRQRKQDAEATRQGRVTTIDHRAPARSANDGIRQLTGSAGKIGSLAISGAFSIGEKLLAGLFSILDPPMTPLQRHQASEKKRQEREFHADAQHDLASYLSERAAERRKLDDEQGAERQQYRDRPYGRDR